MNMLNRDIGVIEGWKIYFGEMNFHCQLMPSLQDDLVEASCDLDHVVLQPENVKTEESPNKVS